MITPRRSTAAEDVAGHYDELDVFYRRLWGEHLHHGLWVTGRETPQQAVMQLLQRVADQLSPSVNDQLCDVGCGYGGTARYMAETHRAQVTGLTISQAQYDYAVRLQAGAANPEYRLQNWEHNSLPSSSFDGLVSIECLAHIQNKQVFFDQVYRVLKPGGRAVITAWLAAPHVKPWQENYLLEPICREGRLPSLGCEQDYRQMIEAAGLHLVRFDDLSEAVAKTWRICASRAATLLGSPAAWRFLVQRRTAHAVFLLTVWRMWIAYRTGAIRYGFAVMQK